jgi:hypothetical protein
MGMTGRLSACVFTFLLSVTLVGSQQQPPAARPTGLLLGRVLDAQSGQPLAGVSLQLAPQIPQAGTVRPLAVVSDAQGRFLFSELARGAYLIHARTGGNGFTPNGFLVTGAGFLIGSYLEGGLGQRRPNGPLRPVELADGQRITDLEIRMWRAAVVTGRIVDEAGEPLVGHVVGIVAVSNEGRLLNGPTMRTDDRGAYRFSGLAPGAYVVFVPQTQVSMPVSTGDEAAAGPPDPTARQRFTAASAPSPSIGGVRVGDSLVSMTSDPARFPTGSVFYNATAPASRDRTTFVYHTTFHPSGTSLSQSPRIRLAPGEEREGVDVQLQPVPATSVSGVVMDELGPVPGMGLKLLPADQGEDASVLETAHTASDSRGAFVFPVVPAGRYTLIALRSDGVPSGNTQQPIAQPRRISEQAGAWGMQSVVVTNRPLENVRLTMRPPVTVNGRIEFSGSSERPSPERLRIGFMTTVYRSKALFRTSGGSSGSFMDPATGRISVKGVSPPGLYRAGPPPMPAPWTLESVTLAGLDVTDAAFNVGESDVNDLVITFTDRPASVTGSVIGNVAEATVFMFPANRTRWVDARAGSRTFRVMRPATSGAYTLANVPPGDYLILAIRDEDAGDWPDQQFLARLAGVATTVKVVANQVTSLPLKVSVLK